MKSSKSTTEKPPAPPPRTVPEIVSYSVGGIALSYFPKAEFEFAIGGIDSRTVAGVALVLNREEANKLARLILEMS